MSRHTSLVIKVIALLVCATVLLNIGDNLGHKDRLLGPFLVLAAFIVVILGAIWLAWPALKSRPSPDDEARAIEQELNGLGSHRFDHRKIDG